MKFIPFSNIFVGESSGVMFLFGGSGFNGVIHVGFRRYNDLLLEIFQEMNLTSPYLHLYFLHFYQRFSLLLWKLVYHSCRLRPATICQGDCSLDISPNVFSLRWTESLLEIPFCFVLPEPASSLIK